MFHKLLLFVLLIAVVAMPPAEASDDPACEPNAGTVITLAIESEALAEQRLYNVYLPPDWCHLNALPLLVLIK